MSAALKKSEDSSSTDVPLIFLILRGTSVLTPTSITPWI